MTLEKAKRQIAALYAAEKRDEEDPPSKQVKFIQEVVSSPSFKAGAFTKQAKAHDMTVKEFKEEVISHPEKYDTTTRRRAQFLKNIERK